MVRIIRHLHTLVDQDEVAHGGEYLGLSEGDVGRLANSCPRCHIQFLLLGEVPTLIATELKLSRLALGELQPVFRLHPHLERRCQLWSWKTKLDQVPRRSVRTAPLARLDQPADSQHQLPPF